MTTSPRFLRDPWWSALLALAAYLAFDLLLPLVPLPRQRPPLAVMGGLLLLTTTTFMLLQLWLTQAVVNLRTRPAWSVALTLIFAALLTVVYLYHLTPLLRGLAITLGCAFLGILLSRIVREANVLLPVALVAMPVDYLGAMTSKGFTQNMVAQHPNMVRAISVPVPSAGSAGPHGGLHVIGFIGPGDALFMAFFFAVVLRLDLNVRGTFWWMYGLLTATMLLVLFSGINIAALIPMGLAVVIANKRFFKLKREEVFATIYAAILVLMLVGGFYLYSHSHFFRHSS